MRALVDIANAVLMISKLAGVGFLVAVSRAGLRSGSFPRWFNQLGLLSAAVLVVSSCGLFIEGSFSQFGGPLDLLGTAPAGLWCLAMALQLAFEGSGR